MLYIEEIIDNIEDVCLTITKKIKKMEFYEIDDCQKAVNILTKLSNSMIKIAIARRNDPQGFEDRPQLVEINTLQDVEFMRNLVDKEEARIKRKNERLLQKQNRKCNHKDDEDLFQAPVYVNESEENCDISFKSCDVVDDFVDDYLKKYGESVDDEYVQEEVRRKKLRAEQKKRENSTQKLCKNVDVIIETVTDG